MEPRRIRGRSVRDALRRVELELGRGALIVETRAVGGEVEVVAVPAPVRPAVAPATSRAFAPLAAAGRRFGLSPALLDSVDAAVRSAGLARAEPHARAVARAAARALHGLLPTASLDPVAFRVAAFVGPTGVGKTTTIAKVAAQERRAGRRVALVTIDTYRLGAAEQLRQFAARLGVPFAVAHDAPELRAQLAAVGDADRILVDTAGRAPRDAGAVRETDALLGGLARTVLCVSAGSRRVDTEAVFDAWSSLRPGAVTLTKWDETTVPGEALSVAAERGLPLAYVTVGQRVPDDIVAADGPAIAAHALGLGEDVALEILA